MSEYKKWEKPPKIKIEGVITTCIAVPVSRYIDAEWLKQNFNGVFWSQVAKTIDSAPSIDIVRCKECKNNGKDDCPMRWWNDDWMEYEMLNDEEGFCNFGEREGE